MDAKDKAKELLNDFDGCKGYALRCIEEVLNEWDDYEKNYYGKVNNSFNQDHWEDVKSEINKL